MIAYNKTGFDDETRLFNRDIKEAYMEELNEVENTLKTILGTFRLTAIAENDYNRDIFEMSKIEFEEVLKVLKCKSLKSLITRFSILDSYITWAYENGYCNVPVTSYFTQDDLEKYVFKVNNFISYDEIINIFVNNERTKALNIQDVAAMLCLYEGIKGTQNQELVNLMKNDIDYKNKTVTVKTKDDDGNIINERIVHIKEVTLYYLNQALLETDYKRVRVRNNKEYELLYPLPYNGYVLRQPVIGGKKRTKDECESINWTAINSRIKRLAISVKMPYLTTQSIYQSGMLYKLLEIEEEQGYLNKEDYIRVVTEAGQNEETYFTLKQLYLTRFNTESVDGIRGRD
ncbi:hypothetical protein KQI86_03980 [Clostridium sp. MSJ-11]|uniref:MrpR N-terminal core-binding domain-containing protein n=1 Tax=Clostridium mobile TaxID=2841512 RepID=A0ABS6EG79_9CLOT|nr:hypothetical protein [Clostridium mobile]MBU5483475.1 hypothetical protein [Clostridium mobile]